MKRPSRIRIERPSQIVAAELRTLILRGELDGETRLPPEAELAEQLGVSRHHLREALRMLEQDGLVRIRRGHGGGISPAVPEADALARTFEGTLARRGVVVSDLALGATTVFTAVAEVAAQNATEEDCARLDAIVEQEQQLDRVDIDVSSEFTYAVADATHNATLTLLFRMVFLVEHNSLRGLRGNLDALVGEPGWREHVIRGHRALAQAVRAHDAARAGETMRRQHEDWEQLLVRSGLDPTTATLPDTW